MTANMGMAESLRQFIEVWRLLAKPYERSDRRDMPGIALSWAGVAFPFHNVVFVTEKTADPDLLSQRLETAAGYMRERRPTNGVLFVCLDNVCGPAKEQLPQIMEDVGFAEAFPAAGMAGNILPFAKEESTDLEIKRIGDRETVHDFVMLNCLSYQLPLELGDSIVDEQSLWAEHAYGYVGYSEGQPVSTATCIVNGDCLLLYLVATHPDHRRFGYGRAVVRHALERAHQATGIKRSVLHATRDGYPLYQALGYQDSEPYMAYVLRA